MGSKILLNETGEQVTKRIIRIKGQMPVPLDEVCKSCVHISIYQDWNIKVEHLPCKYCLDRNFDFVPIMFERKK